MAEIIVAILILAGVVLVGALLFGGWLIVAVVRLIVRIVGGGRRVAPPALPADLVRCAHPQCRADNAGRARFCRRCGRMLNMAEPGAARRVAMW